MAKGLVLILAALTASLARPASSAPHLIAWGSFSSGKSNIVGGDYEVQILASRPGSDGAVVYRFIQTVHRLNKTRTPDAPYETHPVVSVADSDGCPAIKARMAALAKVTPVRIDVPGAWPAQGFGLDVPEYALDAPILAGDGFSGAARIHIATFEDTPVKSWIDGTMTALRACWTSAP